MDFDKIILGENCIYTSNMEVTGINNNILVMGSTGCGKTMSIIESRLLETYSRNLIVTVTKRQIIKKYIPVFQKRDYKVWDLNFVSPDTSNIGFDPLQFISTCADITFLATSIVLANPKKESSNIDPYWDEAAISLLSAEIAYVLVKNSHATLAEVLDFHNNMIIREESEVISTNYDQAFDNIGNTKLSLFALNCWRSFKHLPVKQACNVFSGLNTTLDKMFTPELCKLFKIKEKIDISQLSSKKTILFVTSSPVNYSINAFVSIFYGIIFKELYQFAEYQPDGTLPISIDVLADDFAVGCPVYMFDRYISIFRESGLSVTLAIQSESQLLSVYGQEKATTIINNCDTLVFMGSTDLNICENVAKRANCPLEDVLYMPIGNEYLFRRGQKPICTSRYKIKDNDLYRKIS